MQLAIQPTSKSVSFLLAVLILNLHRTVKLLRTNESDVNHKKKAEGYVSRNISDTACLLKSITYSKTAGAAVTVTFEVKLKISTQQRFVQTVLTKESTFG